MKDKVNKVSSCSSCKADGIVDPVTGEDVGDANYDNCKAGNVEKSQCPDYAKAACFNVEGFVEDLRINKPDPNKKTFQRGCSYFDFADIDQSFYNHTV